MKTSILSVSLVLYLFLCLFGISNFAVAESKNNTIIVYDNFDGDDEGDYTLSDYESKWYNPFGLGEIAVSVREDTRKFDNGAFEIDAAPFLSKAGRAGDEQ